MPGESLQKKTLRFQLPPSKVQAAMVNKIALQIRKDQEYCVQKDTDSGKLRSSGEQVMPRYLRFQSRCLYQNENWGHKIVYVGRK